MLKVSVKFTELLLIFGKVMQLRGFFILLTTDFYICLYLSGLCQSDSINRLTDSNNRDPIKRQALKYVTSN
jgi:hypothetical protein